MPWYNQGTVDVTANSDTVTGTGTAFSANARVGDAFRGPDGRWYEVTNIASAAVLSISPAYVGESVSAGPYSIAPMQGYVKESADRLRKVVDEFGAILAELGTYGPTLKIDAVGLLADRDQYDSASAGFTFYASDSEQLYLKLSSTLGDWSAGAPVARGPAGEKGDTGDVTPEAIAARDTAQAAAESAEDSAQAAAASAAAVAAIGAGWTPVIALVPDGERIVMQVDDWTGGESNKPAVGMYVGPSGFVATAAEATNIRPQGGGTVSSVNGAGPDENGNVQLGTAANADVQTSVSDTTTGALMVVGAGGLLGPSAIGSNANAARPSGLYGFSDGANTPFGLMNMLSSDWGPDPRWQSQLALGVATNKAFFRSITKDQSATTPWAELFHTGNVSPFIQTLLDDADAAAARSTLGTVLTESKSDQAAGRLVKNGDKQVCTAWANFSSTGTIAIRDSFNVSSITDLGVGSFRLNFIEPMANASFSISGASDRLDGVRTPLVCRHPSDESVNYAAVRLVEASSGAPIDANYVDVHVFGGK